MISIADDKKQSTLKLCVCVRETEIKQLQNREEPMGHQTVLTQYLETASLVS